MKKFNLTTAIVMIAEKIGEHSALLRQSLAQGKVATTEVSEQAVEQYLQQKEAQLVKQRELAEAIRSAEVESGQVDWRVFEGIKKVVFVKQNAVKESNALLTASYELQGVSGSTMGVFAITATGLTPIWKGEYDYRIDIRKRTPDHLKQNDLLVVVYGDRPVSRSGYTS